MKFKDHYHCDKRKTKKSIFSLCEIDKEKIMEETRRLNKPKASQKADTVRKIIKDNAGIFSDYLFETVNNAIKTSNFLNCLKLVDPPL